jgi:hypothetical protein
MKAIRRQRVTAYTGVWLSFAIFLSGCGAYSFSSSGAAHINSIAIPIFENRTSEFGINEQLTNAVINEFTRDNTLKISDRRGADSVLEGSVLFIEDRAGAYTSDEQVSDIQVIVTVTAKYEDIVKRKTVWEEEIVQWGTFDPDSGTDSRETAINEAVEKIANEILNKSVSSW